MSPLAQNETDARERVFVSGEWLQARLVAPDLAIVDGSYFLSSMNRNAEAEYLAGHVPGAVRFDIDAVKDMNSTLPHMMPDAAQFTAAAGALGISDAMTIVVYDGMGLFSAPRVRWMFKAFGASDVRILDGGFPRWRAEGRPVSTGVEPTRPAARFTARFDDKAVADLEDIRAALTEGKIQVVDARPADRFRGEAPEPRAGLASGHMPGSLNLPFTEIVIDGSLKDAEGLAAAFAAAGVDPSRPVITSCGSGVSAAILSTALEVLGHPARSLYDGSWAEWGGRGDCPVATVT